MHVRSIYTLAYPRDRAQHANDAESHRVFGVRLIGRSRSCVVPRLASKAPFSGVAGRAKPHHLSSEFLGRFRTQARAREERDRLVNFKTSYSCGIYIPQNSIPESLSQPRHYGRI
jgi:hypothetical protein